MKSEQNSVLSKIECQMTLKTEEKSKKQDKKSVFFTKNAIDRISEIQKKHKKSLLQINISEGGCAGMTYKLSFEEPNYNSDAIIKYKRKPIAFTKDSGMKNLTKCTIDFVSNNIKGKFKITNPNAKVFCQCGESFGV